MGGALLALFLLKILHNGHWEIFKEGEFTGNREVSSLQLREDAIDNTVWKKELLAQKYGRFVDDIWDALNVASNKFSILTQLSFQNLILADYRLPRVLPNGIFLFESTNTTTNLSTNQWMHLLRAAEHQGWVLDNLELRHTRFLVEDTGRNPVSIFSFSAHLTQTIHKRRAVIWGEIAFHWLTTNRGVVSISHIDARRLAVKVQEGEPGFSLISDTVINPIGKSTYADPLLLYDLNGDGLSEIILAARNCVYRNLGKFNFSQENLCRYFPGQITTALIADFNKDKCADFLCAKSEGLFLYLGSTHGTFEDPGIPVWTAKLPLKNAMAMTCGDIDQDGDLDVFVGQYRVPTLGQILRPHYYDANDGFPAYLLLNDGNGQFSDATEKTGLGEKRRRRVYSCSFVDLFNSGNLDLVVVSDFAGLDLYRNQGLGHFLDVTQSSVIDSKAFGMAHAVADLNVDGQLDLLMIGMPSPTVDRLEALGLRRAASGDDGSMRARMSYGNRLYLAQPEGIFRQTSFNDSLAKTGWSWGCSLFDVDNDGYPDVYIANGLESKQTVRDYEQEFWLHDIYIDETVSDIEATSYFLNKFQRTRGQGWSYGGYEKNRLFLNQKGMSFLEVGHLFGVALEQDSRNVVSDDLDGDGRIDLIVTTLEAWPSKKHTLKIFQNRMETTNHWIGFRFADQKGGTSGIRVTLFYGQTLTVKDLVTGDSHRSQHANAIHFGLGITTQLDRVEIRWPGNKTIQMQNPKVDCYHFIGSTP